jgi:hypothetical protein
MATELALCAATGHKRGCSNVLQCLDQISKNVILLCCNDSSLTFSDSNKLCSTHWTAIVRSLCKRCILPDDCCKASNKSGAIRNCTIKLQKLFGIEQSNIKLGIHHECYMYYNNNPEKAVKLTEIIKAVAEAESQSMHVEVGEFSNLLRAVDNAAQREKPVKPNCLGPLQLEIREKPQYHNKSNYDTNGFILVPRAFAKQIHSGNTNKQRMYEKLMQNIAMYRQFFLQQFEADVNADLNEAKQIVFRQNRQQLCLLNGWEYVFNGFLWQKRLEDSSFSASAADYARDVLVHNKLFSRTAANQLIADNFKVVVVTSESKEQNPHMASTRSDVLQVIFYSAPSNSTLFALRSTINGEFTTGAEQWKNLNYWQVDCGDMAIFSGTTVHADCGSDINETRLLICFTLRAAQYNDDFPVISEAFQHTIRNSGNAKRMKLSI